MRVITFVILINLFSGLSAQARLYQEKINFRYRSADLTSENLVEIKKIWERLPLNSAVELLLISDREMRKVSPEKQTVLTKARANSVKLFLTTQKMVSHYNIEINLRSFIEEEKIHGTSASFKRKVRDPYKTYSVVLSKEEAICYTHTEAEQRALSSKEPTVFRVTTTQDQMLTGPGGVIILIPSHSFLLPDDKQTADVTIKLWEFLTTEDMLLAGLTTMSRGRMLETGGMIYISAEYEGNCLRLLRSSKIIVKFPVSGEKVDSMRLFKGIPYKEAIDWRKTNSLDTGGPSTGAEGDSLAVGYYVLESHGFGWINCDRFTDNSDRINVTYTCPVNFAGNACLVFIDMKSIFPGDFSSAAKNNLVFCNVPDGKEAVLLVYAISTDQKKIFYSKQKVTLGVPLKDDLKFAESTPADFKDILKYIAN